MSTSNRLTISRRFRHGMSCSWARPCLDGHAHKDVSAPAGLHMNILGPDGLKERNCTWAARIDRRYLTSSGVSNDNRRRLISGSAAPIAECLRIRLLTSTPASCSYIATWQISLRRRMPTICRCCSLPECLKVQHIMVVGHFGCGGVSAAVDGRRRGLVDHWLLPIRELSLAHRRELDALRDERSRLDRLCELNVMQQVKNVASDVFVLDGWARGQDLSLHGGCIRWEWPDQRSQRQREWSGAIRPLA